MGNIGQRLIPLLGLALLVAIAWALSHNRRRIPIRTVLWGFGLQLAFAILILKTAPGQAVFAWLGGAFRQLIAFTDEGIAFVFGSGAEPVLLTEKIADVQYRVQLPLAFRALPVIIFFASLMGILYHLGIMQRIVAAMAWLMRRTMRVSGAEALSAAGNVFLGMTESPLLIRPYVAGLTRSELFAVMVGGLATIAGSVMAVYVSFGITPEYLLCASVMSAPAALAIAKIMEPETEEPATAGTVHVAFQRETRNVIDAAAAGAWDGLRLALNVAAMLIAFVALLAMINYLLGELSGGMASLGWHGWPRKLEHIFGWVFRPLAFLMGVPWGPAQAVGSVMGIGISANEWIAYTQLGAMSYSGLLPPRAVAIGTFALCGFANFGSLGILIGGIGGLAPERRPDLSRLALRALVGGAIACYSTAAIAGMLLA